MFKLFKKQNIVNNSYNSLQLWCERESVTEVISVWIDINVWRLKKNYLDLGVKINNWENIKKINIYFPFVVKKEEFRDLGEKLSNQQTLKGVFNENYVPDKKTKHIEIKEDNKIRFIASIIDKESDITFEEKYDGTIVAIPIDKEQYGRESCNIPLYIRFRVCCQDFGALFKKIKPKNSFFESAFNESELIDFRLNEKRNQQPTLISQVEKSGKLQIEKINFFVVSPAEHEIKFNGSNITYKRQLENNNFWKDYLDSEYPSMNVYKVKIENKENQKIEDFSAYLNIQYRKSNIFTILKYIVVIGITSVAFGLLASWLFELLKGLKG